MEEFLLALRNYLVTRVAGLSPMDGYKCFQIRKFNIALDLLDPEFYNHHTSVERAYSSFQDGLTCIKFVERMAEQ